ncbi:MAG: trypsin-like serine protease [Oligoflexales bacterium]
MLRLLLPSITLIAFAACRNQPAEKKRSPKNPACLNIVNGEKTTDYPSVVAVVTDLGNNSMGACTGTFVGHNVLLTATHCLAASNMTADKIGILNVSEFDLVRLSTYKIIKPKTVINNGVPATASGRSADNDLEDLTILIFADNTASAFSPIYQGLPVNGSPGALIGYGVTDVHGGREPTNTMRYKRLGINNQVVSDPSFIPKIAAGLKAKGYDADFNANGVLSILGNGDDGEGNLPTLGSVGASGDSGGPLFVNGLVAGVASQALRMPLDTVGGEKRTDSITIYVSVASKASQALIEKAKASGAQFAVPKETGDNSTNASPTSTNMGTQPVSPSGC